MVLNHHIVLHFVIPSETTLQLHLTAVFSLRTSKRKSNLEIALLFKSPKKIMFLSESHISLVPSKILQ
jgi:hypothetical protein